MHVDADADAGTETGTGTGTGTETETGTSYPERMPISENDMQRDTSELPIASNEEIDAVESIEQESISRNVPDFGEPLKAIGVNHA